MSDAASYCAERKTSISPMGSIAINASRISVAEAFHGKKAVLASLKLRRSLPWSTTNVAVVAFSSMTCSGNDILTGGSPMRTTSVTGISVNPATASVPTLTSGIGPMFRGEVMNSAGP